MGTFAPTSPKPKANQDAPIRATDGTKECKGTEGKRSESLQPNPLMMRRCEVSEVLLARPVEKLGKFPKERSSPVLDRAGLVLFVV